MNQISNKKRLEIANTIYANVSGRFATFNNPKNRGVNFTWENWIESCGEQSEEWIMIANIPGHKKEGIKTLANR